MVLRRVVGRGQYSVGYAKGLLGYYSWVTLQVLPNEAATSVPCLVAIAQTQT